MKLMAENTFLYIDEAKMANETNGWKYYFNSRLSQLVFS